MSAALIEAIVILASKYGPDIITAISNLFKKQDTVTIDEIEKLFSQVRSWESFDIPETAVTAPTK